MQAAGNVGRRQDDGEGALGQRLAVGAVARLEEAALGPPGVVSSLDLQGVVAGRRQVTRHICSTGSALPCSARVTLSVAKMEGLTLLLSGRGGVDPFLGRSGRSLGLLLLLLLLLSGAGRTGLRRCHGLDSSLGELLEPLRLLLSCRMRQPMFLTMLISTQASPLAPTSFLGWLLGFALGLSRSSSCRGCGVTAGRSSLLSRQSLLTGLDDLLGRHVWRCTSSETLVWLKGLQSR